jgi:hypothetical protein
MVQRHGAEADCFSFGWIENKTIVKEPAVQRRNALLETGKLARKRWRGEEEKKLCIISILLLIYTVRGYN